MVIELIATEKEIHKYYNCCGVLHFFLYIPQSNYSKFSFYTITLNERNMKYKLLILSVNIQCMVNINFSIIIIQTGQV